MPLLLRKSEIRSSVPTGQLVMAPTSLVFPASSPDDELLQLHSSTVATSDRASDHERTDSELVIVAVTARYGPKSTKLPVMNSIVIKPTVALKYEYGVFTG